MPRRILTFLAVALLALLGAVIPQSAAQSAVPLITPTSTVGTLAGDGVARHAGDGGPATLASLNEPRGRLAVAPDGSVYVADTFNNRIRRIAPDGTIRTVAGTGVAGSGGDGGPAVNAQLRWPHDVVLDGAGNLYIADSANHRIRMMSRDGVIRTVAGTGVGGYNGDGIQATSARIFRPKAVALRASALYFADGDNNRIRRVDLTSRIITTIAGTGVAGYSGDGGPATQARFNAPHALEFDSLGNLFVADTQNSRIRRIGVNGVVTTVAGTGVAGFSGDNRAATAARLNLPRGMTVVDDTVMYIADSNNARVRRVDLATGTITTVVGNGRKQFSGDGGPAISAGLMNPRGVAVDPRGRLLIADTLNDRVRVVTP
jgi:sugar lactone lactonase YvrE